MWPAESSTAYPIARGRKAPSQVTQAWWVAARPAPADAGVTALLDGSLSLHAASR